MPNGRSERGLNEERMPFHSSRLKEGLDALISPLQLFRLAWPIATGEEFKQRRKNHQYGADVFEGFYDLIHGGW